MTPPDMSPPTFYLETSVWGSLGRRQPRDRKQVVHRLLQLLDGVRGTCVISDVVIAEMQDADPRDVAEIRRRIDATQHLVHPISEPMESLALAYIAAGILPEGREADAIHVAAATCLELDYLVSWNHRHMTRPRKRVQYEAVNQLHNYLKTPRICNPFEVCHEL